MRMMSGATTRRSSHVRSRVLRVRGLGHAVEDLLVGPQQVDGRHDDAEDGHDGPPAMGDEGAHAGPGTR